MNKIINEFVLIFKNPRELHRVLMVIPLAAALSHASYLYVKIPAGVPFTNDQVISIILGGFIYLTMWCFVFFSNPNDFKLFLRFVFCGALSALAHRLIVDVDKFGTWYYSAVSLAAIAFVLIFIVTGKTSAINDITIWFNIKLNEKSDKPPLHSVFNSDHDRNSDTG